MAKVKVFRHAMSLSAKINRAYNQAVKRHQNWCEERHLKLKTWSEADNYDICVLSQSEYDVGEYRKNVIEDNRSLFMSEDDYEKFERESDVE